MMTDEVRRVLLCAGQNPQVTVGFLSGFQISGTLDDPLWRVFRRVHGPASARRLLAHWSAAPARSWIHLWIETRVSSCRVLGHRVIEFYLVSQNAAKHSPGRRANILRDRPRPRWCHSKHGPALLLAIVHAPEPPSG